MNDPRDTTGVWYGRYFATAWDVPENSFIAHLDEVDGAVDGTITEPDDTGDDEIRRAFVSGTRSADTLNMTRPARSRTASLIPAGSATTGPRSPANGASPAITAAS